MIQEVSNKEFYHICIYEDFQLQVGESYDTNNIIRTHSQCSKEKQKTESCFDVFRLEHYPKLPSRKSCFYICLKQDVEKWLRELIKHHRYGYQIFKISCSGSVFWADSYYFSDEDIRSPEKYWSGCDPYDYNCFVEGLFIGNYHVIEECTRYFGSPM